jgi:hypothetical protein
LKSRKGVRDIEVETEGMMAPPHPRRPPFCRRIEERPASICPP